MASTVLFAAFRRLSDSSSFCVETSPKGACACNFAFAAILPAGSVTWAPSSTAHRRQKDLTEFRRIADTRLHWGDLRVLTIVMPSRHRASSSPPAIICVER